MIAIKNLHKWYGTPQRRIHVLQGIDLNVRKGEQVAIMGASGAGKSTLLHILGTLEQPDDGEMIYDGQDTRSFNDDQLSAFRNAFIGFVFQFHHLLPEFSALENVMLPDLIAGQDRKKSEERAEELLSRMGLLERLHHRPGQLSGGEQQRVSLARAICRSPKVLIADEPTGNLDRENGEKVYALLQELNRERGITLIMATHNRELAARMDRCLTILDGKITDTAN